MFRLTATLCIALVACAPGDAADQAFLADVEGHWSGEATDGDDVYGVEVELEQDGDELVGTLFLDEGVRVWTFDARGHVEDGELSLTGDNVVGESWVSLQLEDVGDDLEGDWTMGLYRLDIHPEDDSYEQRSGEAWLGAAD